MAQATDPDWVDLYKIFEIIQNDVGAIHKRGWGLPRDEVGRFTGSAQPHRHGVQKEAPHPQPMTLAEAQAFIRRMIHAWSSAM
jgi:hypothetical protein